MFPVDRMPRAPHHACCGSRRFQPSPGEAGAAALHGRRPAVRIEPETFKTGGHGLEVSWCLTLPGPQRAGPGELPKPVRSRRVTGKPRALRSRFHLRQGPLQDARPPPAAQPPLPDERSHRHRAPRRTLHLNARSQPAPRRPLPREASTLSWPRQARDSPVLTARSPWGTRLRTVRRDWCARTPRKPGPGRPGQSSTAAETGVRTVHTVSGMPVPCHAGHSASTSKMVL